MSEPRRKWSLPLVEFVETANNDEAFDCANLEALRAIAEELETLNGLLKRVVGGKILIGSRDDAGEPEQDRGRGIPEDILFKPDNPDDEETAVRMNEINKARAEPDEPDFT